MYTIKSVYIKSGKGSGSADANRLLDAGAYEIAGDISGLQRINTNDCLFFYCEPGTQIDWNASSVCSFCLRTSKYKAKSANAA